MKDKRKKVIIVVIVFIAILAVLSGTLAFWRWATSEEQKTAVTFTFEQDFACSADGGGNITDQDAFMAPTSCTNTEHAIQREITVTPTLYREGITIDMDLWLNVVSMDSGLRNTENFRYALTTNPDSCESGLVTSGTFKGKNNGGRVMLLDQWQYGNSLSEKYYLYIWLDGAEKGDNTMNQSFTLSLGGNCTDGGVEPEKPVLDSGMIPVKIANDGTVTTVSNVDPTWYNYSAEEWANVVLVNETNRNTYLNSLDDNVVVSQDDILAYYVWIPRYKYKIWTTDATKTTQPQTIDIIFEKASDTMSLGTTVGSYRTHPAFWWDDDSDKTVDTGETIPGFWVGKFETNPEKNSACYTQASVNNCNNKTQNPTILPNEGSLRYQTIGNQFATSQRISASGNPYGISNTYTDAHMAKNSEWGAVAYLSHSQYGINSEIRINNYYNSNHLTSCGASYENATIAQITTCGIIYGEGTSYPQSTTGNITGVFDMALGASDRVMANFNNTAHSTYFSKLPESKYYDVYLASQFTGNSSNNMTLCTIETCGGHAMYETAGWYNDYATFISAYESWFIRGYGSSADGTTSGTFALNTSSGITSNSSWRSILIVKN